MSEAATLDRRLLGALALATTLAPLGSTSLAVALPSISGDLGVGLASTTQWLVTSYLLVNIVCQSPGGKLGDLIGYRRALALGQSLVAVGTLCALVAPHLAVLVVARVLVAAGGAAVGPSAMALARNNLPAERHARAFATFGALMGLAAAVGPPLGGALTRVFGWRAVFAPNLVILALSVALARSSPGEEPRSGARPTFDGVGSALLAVGLISLVVGLRVGRPAAVTAAALVLAAFGRWERRVASPVIDLALFRQATFTFGGLVVAAGNMAMYAMLFELPTFFARVRRVDAASVGAGLLALTLGMVACSPLGARLSERIGARATVTVGMLCGAAGMYGLRHGATLRTPLDALPALIALGAGIGLSNSPAQASAMVGVPRDQAGMASGVLSTLRYLGGVAGIAVLGALSGGADAAGVLATHDRAAGFFTVVMVVGAALAAGLPSGSVPRVTRG